MGDLKTFGERDRTVQGTELNKDTEFKKERRCVRMLRILVLQKQRVAGKNKTFLSWEQLRS